MKNEDFYSTPTQSDRRTIFRITPQFELYTSTLLNLIQNRITIYANLATTFFQPKPPTCWTKWHRKFWQPSTLILRQFSTTFIILSPKACLSIWEFNYLSLMLKYKMVTRKGVWIMTFWEDVQIWLSKLCIKIYFWTKIGFVQFLLSCDDNKVLKEQLDIGLLMYVQVCRIIN